MSQQPLPSFDEAHLFDRLSTLGAPEVDALPFGLIGFGLDPKAIVQIYSARESREAGLRPEQVLGLPLFEVVAQCMNNYLISQRFEDSLAADAALDEGLDWVFTLRMRPTPVRLRLLAKPGAPMRYVAVHRPAA